MSDLNFVVLFLNLVCLGPRVPYTLRQSDDCIVPEGADSRALKHESLLACVARREEGTVGESQADEIEIMDAEGESNTLADAVDARDLDDVEILRHTSHGFVALARQVDCPVSRVVAFSH